MSDQPNQPRRKHESLRSESQSQDVEGYNEEALVAFMEISAADFFHLDVLEKMKARPFRISLRLSCLRWMGVSLGFLLGIIA
ncbi:unnamed protein product [Rhodiola kirilowii]